MVTIEDGKWFTPEVWNLTRCWPDSADVRIFYVPGFEDGTKIVMQNGELNSNTTSGLTLRTMRGDVHVHKPIVFIDQLQNRRVLQTTGGRFGLLEHEIGHVLGLPDNGLTGSLMYGNAHGRSGNLLTPEEIATAQRSALLTADPGP
ncbi:MAG TPA: hypothetical protein VIT67_16250 [Povalibacter sp.]